MNYQHMADFLWYMGHILTGLTIIGNHYDNRVGVGCVFVGQTLTMISRPIGRLQNRSPSPSLETIPFPPPIADDTV